MLPIINGKSDVQAAVCYVVNHGQAIWQIDTHVFSLCVGHLVCFCQLREGLLVGIFYSYEFRLEFLGFSTVSLQNIRKKGVGELLWVFAKVRQGIVIFLDATDVEPRGDLVDKRHMEWLNQWNPIYFGIWAISLNDFKGKCKEKTDDGCEKLTDIRAIIFLMESDALVEKSWKGAADSGRTGLQGRLLG